MIVVEGNSVASFSAYNSAKATDLPSISGFSQLLFSATIDLSLVTSFLFLFLFLHQRYKATQHSKTATPDIVIPAVAPPSRFFFDVTSDLARELGDGLLVDVVGVKDAPEDADPIVGVVVAARHPPVSKRIRMRKLHRCRH